MHCERRLNDKPRDRLQILFLILSGYKQIN